MDHQATLNVSPPRDSSAQALAHSMADIAHYMITIVGLQSRLFAVDLRALRKGVLRGLGIWVAGFGLLVAALPTALIGTGLWLADIAHLPMAVGLLWVACGAALLVIGLFLAGWRQLVRQQVGLQRSKKELRANLAAMRQVLLSTAGRDSEDYPISSSLIHSNRTTKEPIRWQRQSLIKMSKTIQCGLASRSTARKRLHTMSSNT